MLTFLSAFLSLVVGVHPVELTVSGDVATVELRLDGETVGHLRGEPWVLACDFGPELAPHELVAIGRDADGHEIARAAQWLNLPQPRSHAELVLDDPADSPRQARLVWHSADSATPDAWRLSFDGKPLEVADPRSFELPAYDPEAPHLLQAELHFGSRSARVDLVVGGADGDSVETELTAVPVVTSGKPPTVAEMAGWFSKDGHPLEVVSVERSGADIVLVQEATPRLWGKLRRLHKNTLAHGGKDILSRKLTSGLHQEDTLRVLLPVGERTDGATLEQFHISYDFSTIEVGPSSTGVVEKQINAPPSQGVLATLPYPAEGPLRDDAPRRVADAVAVAGQAAAASRRKRAVVLIKDGGTRDLSANSPAVVRRYLERLQVPLLVWSPEKSTTDDWGEVHDISTSQKLLRGVLKLRQTLGRQTIVWLRGRHLPQDIELSPTAAQRLSKVGAGDDVEIPPELEAEIEPWSTHPVEPPTADVASAIDEPNAIVADAAGADAAVTDAAVTNAESLDSATEATAVALMANEAPTVVDTVEVRLVNVDVVVTTKGGERQHDLVQEDFALYEDGQKVDILHFVPPGVATPGVATPGVVTPGADAPGVDGWGEASGAALEPEPDATAVATASTTDSATAERARLVIFFDLLRLEAADRKRLARALRDVLDESPPMRTMIATYNRTMKIRMPFTNEPIAWTEVLEAIERIQPARLGGPDGRAAMAEELALVQRLLKAAQTPEEIEKAEARRSSALVQLDSITRTLTAEIRETLAALRQLTASLGGVDGRTLLLYVGDNLELTPTLELYEEAELTVASNDLEASRLRSASSTFDVGNDFDNLLREAHAHGVTFYGVTPRNRSSRDVAERSGYGSTVVAGPAGFQGRLTSSRQELVKEAVCRLAVESGGLCQSGGTEPRLLLRQTVADLGGSYSLAYAPKHPPDGKFHRLDVEIVRPGLTARHRPGYVDKTAETRIHDQLAAALYFGHTEDALGVTVTTGEVVPPTASKAGRRQSLVPLEVRMPVERLGLIPLQGGESVGVKTQLLVQTQHQNGGVSGIQEYPITFQVRGERLAVQPPLVYAHQLHLLLEPGQYRVAIGLWDEIGRVGSFLSREVLVE